MQRKDWDGFLLVSNVGLACVFTSLAASSVFAGAAVFSGLCALCMIALIASER